MEQMPPDSLSQVLMRHIAVSENGIAVLDANDIFLYHNATMARMFGFQDRSMIGSSYDDMMTWMFEHRTGASIEAPTLAAWLEFVHSRYRSAPLRSVEVDRRDGRWMLLSEQVHPNGEVIILCSDITPRKQAEAALDKLRADMERLALTDDLSGIPNRRNLLQQLDQELTRAHRARRALCLAMLDLDHFKRINDAFGHPAGDLVLQHFAAFLRAHLRLGDVVGRMGGEEFAVLLPETTLDDALLVLRRIGAKLALERVDAVTPGLSYTFSGGVAMLPDMGAADAQWLLAGADKALYEAKTEGRNRINPFNW